MISLSRQLKDKVRNISDGNSNKAFKLKVQELLWKQVLYDAFSATCEKRKSNFYVGDLEWKNVIDYVENTMKKYLL